MRHLDGESRSQGNLLPDTLDDYVAEAAKEQNRYVVPEPFPENGMYFRTDHFSFAKRGVPSLYATEGMDHVEHGEEWTREQVKKYTENHYHKPSDRYDPDWDLSGMVEDLQLLFQVGCRLAAEGAFPNWKEGTEFRSLRDRDMQASDGPGE